MSDKEITIVEYELVKSNGNLKTLRGSWDGMPKIPDLLDESKGAAADAARDCGAAAGQVRASLSQLLESSIAFFERAGISFQEADQNAAENVDTLTI